MTFPEAQTQFLKSENRHVAPKHRRNALKGSSSRDLSNAVSKSTVKRSKERTLVKPPFKITETNDFIRLRVRSSSSFRKDSLRTQDIGRKGHTKRISGRLKSNNQFETQAFIFSKVDFGRDRAIKEAKMQRKELIDKFPAIENRRK